MKTIFGLLLATAAYAQIATDSNTLLVTNSFNITSPTQYIDNRSAQRQCSIFTYAITSGTGNWQTQLEWSSVGPNGPWISFGSFGIVSHSSVFPIGYGYGYKPFVRINTTAGTSVANFSCENSLFIPPAGTGPSISGALVAGNLVIGTSASSIGDSGLAPPGSAIVGITDTQTLTNKTYDIETNTFKAGSVQATGFTGTGSRIVTSTTSSKTPGDCGAWDSSGNIIDSGSSCSPTPVTSLNQLTFQQAGSSLTRNAQTKAREVFSVTDYGVDATAFNTAITYAQGTRGGAEVFIPCGPYTLSATITVSKPNVSLIGENENCVQISYTGAASAIVWQMSPFTTNPAGEMSGFTLTGTSSATNGILSGQIVGSYWHDIDVSGFTGAGAAAIHFHNAGNLATWTERNVFVNVSTGGTGTARNTHGWLFDSDNAGDSFGYNNFADIKVNVGTGQEGFTLGSGFMYNLPALNMVCNMDNSIAGSTGPICIRSQGNWDSNAIQIRGEFQNTGSGTGTPYAVQMDSGGKFANLLGSRVNVFTTGGVQLGVNNLNSASNTPSQTLVQQSSITSWDTGTFTLGSASTSPQPIQRGNYGSVGLLIGTNIESPYVSMFNASGNKFVVGTVANANNIGQMVDDFDVDTVGQGTLYSKLFVSPDGRFSNGHAPGSIDGDAAVLLGAYTNSSHRSGYTNIYMLSTTGINESMAADPNFSGGWGFIEGVNIAHPMAWAYQLDPVDFGFYEKNFQTPLLTSNLVGAVTHGGNLAMNGHVNQPSGSNNIAGTCSMSGTTSCTFTYSTPFINTPLCSVTANFDVGASNRIWTTPGTNSCAANASAASTGSFTLTVFGNPN